LTPVAFEALLHALTPALSGFGLFSGVSFGSGHGELLGIVRISILDIEIPRKPCPTESSFQASFEKVAAVIMYVYNPFGMNNFHGLSSAELRTYWLKLRYGKASLIPTLAVLTRERIAPSNAPSFSVVDTAIS